MVIKEIKVKSILRKHKRIDSWFISCYGMNFYRGCVHNCIYCDGRNEKYQVNGVFEEDIEIKTNAIDILRKELHPSPRKKPMKKCYIMLGGGVGDSYQNIEEEYRLTRQALQLLKNYKLPVSILTKSTLIERDIDILKQINEQSRVLINFSISSTNDKISRIFEPNVSLPSERLQTIKKLKKEGFSCGIFLLPVIPFITDTLSIMKQTLKDINNAGVDFIIFGGMTLKKERQKDYFYRSLKKHYPNLLIEYENIYKDDKWGHATSQYYASIHETFNALMKQYRIPKRIPSSLFNDILSENDCVSVILDQLDYLCKMQGKRSPYGYASYQISQLSEPISSMKFNLQEIKGVGKVTEGIILEILETGTSRYYEKLLY